MTPGDVHGDQAHEADGVTLTVRPEIVSLEDFRAIVTLAKKLGS